MKKSWTSYIRRLVALFVAGAATAWSSAIAYAQSAADSAADGAYADGWQAGDNGGSGFGPWNFDGSYAAPPDSIHLINAAHPENDLGTAWALSLNDEFGLARAGRMFDAPLQVGQTFSVTIDVPTEHRFFKGYTIRLNSGGGSICYGGVGCTPDTMPVERFALWAFHDQDNRNEWGHWRVTPSTSPFFIPLHDEDVDAGVRIDFTLTGPEAYSVTLTPLDQPTTVFSRSGALANPGGGPIDWIEFLHYDMASDPQLATDIYISRMQITAATAVGRADFDSDGDVDGADFLRWQRGLGAAAGAALGQGDSNADGDVDAADLADWIAQFGTSAVTPASAIPEPACVTMVIVAALGTPGLEFVRRLRRFRAPRRTT
jgi:hypothetical protein